jgi:iron complex outermembrane receptor protein
VFKKSKIGSAVSIALGGSLVLAALPALAQVTQRVEITGSAIKRIDAETVVPVTTFRAEDLRAQGITTIEQILSQLSAAQVTQTSSQQVGAGTGGASFADLRGIGASKTLVLLNGRRVANNAIDGSAVDLNMIPFAALQRVEVLRDGASSLYGTDAIGGVINFITRSDFTGGAITLGVDRPRGKGGEAENANVGFGFGNLARQGFNVMGFIDVTKQDPIGGTERPFNARQPGGLSPTTFPGNYFQAGAVGNPAAPGCTTPSFLTPAGDGTSCIIKTSEFVDYSPRFERTSIMLRGSLAFGTDHTLSAEWFGSQNESTTAIAPVPYGGLRMNPRRPDGSPNPYFPGNATSSIPTPNIPINPAYIGPTATSTLPAGAQPGYINVRWRNIDGGSRSNTSDNKQQRLLVGMDGLFSGWDYRLGLSYNENKIVENVNGYSNGVMITAAVRDGVINPFGAQSAAGAALIEAARLGGNLQNHTGKVTTLDARGGRELGDWMGSGRQVALALGGEVRTEDFISAANPPVAALLIASTGVDPDSKAEGKRDVAALYAELNVPVFKGLDLTGAVRYDRYSDFGDTVNPKFSVRYKPFDQLLLRASYSTGFRAPSLYELNAVQSYTNTGTVNDPINCPGTPGVALPGKSPALYCNVQFQRLTGGNTNLQPEESKNWNIGIVLEPTPGVTMGLDFWSIKLTNAIAALSETTVLGDTATFGQYIRRNGDGDLSTDGTGCPGPNCGYLDLRQQNLGDTNTNGVDFSLNLNHNLGAMGRLKLGLNGTYVTKYEYQDFIGGPFNQNVGVYVGTGPIFRIQHAVSAAWTLGNWTLGGVARYKSGYTDQDPSNKVAPYQTTDAYVSWAAMKGLNLTFGINNLADTDPPYSNQGEVFQANYDPRFTDPTGRKYYLRATYQF